MNMRKKIKHAYDQIHVSEEFTERLKQEIYQKDFHEPEEAFSEFFQVEEAPKRQIGRYMGFLAASLVMGAGIGISMWNMLDCRNNEVFNPAATVPVQIREIETTAAESETEETEEEYAYQIVYDIDEN